MKLYLPEDVSIIKVSDRGTNMVQNVQTHKIQTITSLKNNFKVTSQLNLNKLRYLLIL